MEGDLIKAGDLKPLTDAGLVHLAARMAVRVEPWCPAGAGPAWAAALAALVEAGNGETPPARVTGPLARTLLDHGARGTYGPEPEHLSHARNQAAAALACGLEASQLGARKDRWKRVRDAGKHMASVYALQAHAGRLPIELALTAPWAAVRADVAAIAALTGPLTLAGLRELAPVWPGLAGPPAWALPG